MNIQAGHAADLACVELGDFVYLISKQLHELSVIIGRLNLLVILFIVTPTCIAQRPRVIRIQFAECLDQCPRYFLSRIRVKLTPVHC